MGDVANMPRALIEQRPTREEEEREGRYLSYHKPTSYVGQLMFSDETMQDLLNEEGSERGAAAVAAMGKRARRRKPRRTEDMVELRTHQKELERRVRETRERRQTLEAALLPLLADRHTRPPPETEPLPLRKQPTPVVEARRQTGLEQCAMRTGAKARTVVRGVRYDDRAPGHKPVRAVAQPQGHDAPSPHSRHSNPSATPERPHVRQVNPDALRMPSTVAKKTHGLEPLPKPPRPATLLSKPLRDVHATDVTGPGRDVAPAGLMPQPLDMQDPAVRLRHLFK